MNCIGVEFDSCFVFSRTDLASKISGFFLMFMYPYQDHLLSLPFFWALPLDVHTYVYEGCVEIQP